jgi:hypothetical protein
LNFAFFVNLLGEKTGEENENSLSQSNYYSPSAVLGTNSLAVALRAMPAEILIKINKCTADAL